MPRKQEELVEDLLKILSDLDDPSDPTSDKIGSYLYVTNPKLSDYLKKFEDHLNIDNPSGSQLRERGYLLEQIIYLVFRGLKGASSFKSFQSAGPQYDLLITGDNEQWIIVCKFLYLDIQTRDIVIEAKAKKDPLPDKDFARLCCIMDLNLTNSGLGIFFTIKGATGFPTKNDSTRQRCLKDCKLRQVLYHAKTGKYIIVLDKDDILSLGKNGTLIKLLQRKIRDVRELSGIPTTTVELNEEIDLPKHLLNLST
jgi:hypothetical protein